ncbi:MAG: HYR domain-containing protein [Saprospiraceae bacterium]
MQTQTVIVDDVTAPVPDVATLPDATGECSVTVSAPTATDNCSGAITGTTTDPLTYTTQGIFTITWTYDDGNGNTSMQTQTVIVDDVTAPSITCPPNDTVAINANCEATLIDYTGLATVSDNCTLPANIVVTQSPTPGIINTETDVTLTATDEAGNVSLPCTFKVFLDDQISPDALCFPDTTVYLDNMGQVTIDVTFVDNGSNDNCSGITLSIDQTMFDCSDIGANTVTLTVLDANGNDATCTTNVIVSDSIPPQLVQCANDTFLIADANCEAVLPDFTASVIFDDNCTAYGDLKITQVPPNGSILTSDTTVAVVALDSVGLISDTCFFLVELRDTTPPTITCPSDTMIVASLDSCNAIYVWPMPIVSDNCGIDTVICSPESGSLFLVGSTKVTCTAVASSGDSTFCDFIVIVKDEQIPYLDCPSDTTIFVSTGIVDTMIFNIGLDSLSDNCMVDTFYHKLTGAMMGGGDGDASGTAFVPGTTTVTYYVEDASGNIDSCSFDVIILQSIIIDLTCPSDYTVSTDAGLCSAVVNTDAPGIDPIAGLDTIFYVLTNATTGSGPDSVPDDQVFNKGVTTVTYTAVSITNDTSICSFSVTVLDQEAPVINCPSSVVTVDNTTDSCGVVFDANLQTATATDNCPGVVVTYSVPTGNLLPIGTNTIIATATDQALTSNTATCTYQIMVRDTQPPLISQCPANIMVNNDFGQCGAAVTWTPPTATDNCGVLLLESTPYEPGDFIPVGTEFITYTAADFAGNVTECIFSVTVRDNEPPSLNPCPGNISVNTQPGLCSAVVSWPFIQPTDNCNVVSFVVMPQSGTVFLVGQTTVQAVATDASGNVTVCSFSVTVTDSEFPTMSGFPGNMTVSSDPGECGAVVTWGAITVNDNCGIDTFYCDAASGDFFPIGMTTVECTVIDVNGNAVNQDFVITVEDDELPTVDCPDNILIYVDSSVVVDPSGFINSFQAVACDSLTLNYNAINAMDNCGVAAISQTGGPVSGSTIAAGMQTLTYLVTDVNGNQSVCGFNITIEAISDPVAIASPSNPCEGGAVVFSTDTYPGATYEWKDPSGAVISSSPSFTLTGVTLAMSGKYVVTISFPFDCVQTAEVDITVFPNPNLGISHNDLLCAAAGTPLTLEAIDSASTGSLNYVWSTPGGAIFFGNPVTVNNPQQGNYAVTATTTNGCTATTSVFIEISAVPKTPDLNGDKTEACIGESIILDGEEFAGPGITYHWSASPDLITAGINDINNHDNQANPTVPGTYIYYFYVTQGGCVSDSAEWQVVVEDYPDFTLSVTGETDCVDGTSDITIEGVTNVAGFFWSIDVNGNCAASQVDSLFTLTGVTEDCSGLYEVTATSAIGCATTQSVNLDITNKPVTPVLQVTDNVICMGGSTTLFLTNTPFGANILCYENNVQVSCATMLGSPIQPMATTEYGVQYDVFGCLSDTIFTTVTVEAPLDVDINRTGDISCVDGTGTVTLSTIPGGNIYEWDGPCGVQVGDVLEIPNITPACSGLYSVSVTGALGQCISIGTLQLEVTGMLGAVTAELLNEPCDGGDLSFCAEPAMPGAIYTWTDPFGNVFSNERCPVTAAISASTPYSVTVNVDGCTSSDDTLVTVITAPIANDETVVGIVNTAQSFNVVVNDVLATDNYTIVVKQNPSHGNVSYNGEGVFTYTPQKDFRETDIMAYEICYDECPDLCDIAFVTILVRYPVDQCIATTVITPNGDGINDPFVVSCLELGGCPNNQLFIFNQWGDQVFEVPAYNNTWEETYTMARMCRIIYFYIFQCDESSPAEKGFVVIHR